MNNLSQENQNNLISTEALRFYYSNIIDVSYLQMVFPFVVVWTFFNTVNNIILTLWLILTISVFIIKIMLAKNYLKTSPPADQIQRWGKYLTITTLFSGILWGIAGFYFHDPDQIFHGLILYMIILGISASSLTHTAYWLPAFYTYTIPAISGVMLGLVFHFPIEGYIPALLLLIFLLILLKMATSSRKVAYDAIRLSLVNTELIKNLEQEKKKAETASNAKTQFLASANHDLRQPVHALSLLVHGLQKELKSVQGKLLFFRLEQSVKNLGNLLESLLDLSRLDASAVKVTPTHFPVSSITSQILMDFLPNASSKGLKFSVRHCNEVLFTDRTLLERLLRNLLDNAFRYTHNGGVVLGFRKRNNDLVFEIWDTGIGISNSESDKIFNEFFQVRNSERDRSKGLGLGLSICQRIAILLGTEIQCRSIPEKGSVFHFKLPVSAMSKPSKETIIHNVKENMNMIALKGKVILVVDDDLEVIRAMSQLIKNWEMIPLTARESDEALDILQQRQLLPDLLICDHRLNSGETGLEGVKKIQKKYLIPALMITGDTAPENLYALNDSGLPIVHKPVTPEILYENISSLLDQK